MTLSNIFWIAITILISSGVVSGLVIWLIKRIINKLFEANNERLKISLQLNHQQNSRVQNERFDVIKKLYADLVRMNEMLEELFRFVKSDKPSTKESVIKVLQPLVDLTFSTKRYSETNSIFFSRSTGLRIENCISELLFCLSKSSYAMVVKSEEIYSQSGDYIGIAGREVKNLPEEDRADFDKTILSISNVREGKLRESMDGLQKEFRNLFSIE